jgi:hypothetical protein
VDDDGILCDDLDIFKHAHSTAGHGTDSGFGGDKQSSTSTLQHLHASFDEDLAPIVGDESINISDLEASKDDLDSVEGDLDGRSRSRKIKDLDETAGSTLERPLDVSDHFALGASSPSKKSRRRGGREGQGEENLFSEEYYQQLRDLGVVFDGEDLSRDDQPQHEFEVLERHLSREHVNDYEEEEEEENRDLIGEYLQNEYDREKEEGEEREEGEGGRGRHLCDRRSSHPHAPNSRASSAPTISGRSFPEISPEDAELMYGEEGGSQQTGGEDDDEIFLINHQLLRGSSRIHAQKLPITPSSSRPGSRGSRPHTPNDGTGRPHSTRYSPAPSPAAGHGVRRSEGSKVRPDSAASQASAVSESPLRPQSGASTPGKSSAMSKARSQESFFGQDKPQTGSSSIGRELTPLPPPPLSPQ